MKDPAHRADKAIASRFPELETRADVRFSVDVLWV